MIGSTARPASPGFFLSMRNGIKRIAGYPFTWPQVGADIAGGAVFIPSQSLAATDGLFYNVA